jgi:hypothetical protein
MRTEQDVVRAWTANEVLLREKVSPFVIQPLGQPPGLRTETEWEYIIAAYLGRSFDSVRSVQVLCNPKNEAHLWIDAYILSRSIFEVDVTLRWCNRKPGNLSMFLDDYHLKVARTFDSLSEQQKADVGTERQVQIQDREATVLGRYKRGPGTMSIMQNLQQICKDLSENEPEPNTLWEYNKLYREASSFAHPTMWHLHSYRAKLSPVTQLTPSPDIGYWALLLAGGCFLRILGQWNNQFRRLSDSQPFEWLVDWEKAAGRDKIEL